MTSDLNLPPWAIGLLVVAGIAAWSGFFFGIIFLIHLFSGWGALRARYPDRPGEPKGLTLHMLSGRVKGVSFSNVLTLSARPSGLRISMLPPFGWVSRPFLAPWDEITAEPDNGLVWRGTRLRFGRPEVGELTIFGNAWTRISEARGVRSPTVS